MTILSWHRHLFSRAGGPATLEATLASARSGDVDAQFALGLKYSTAPRDEQDLAEAARWYRLAAEQDHRLAQLNLGRMLSQGDGVPKDESEALVWMRRAAEGGDAGAQFVLGSKCRRLSLDRSRSDCSIWRVEAYQWLHLAASQGYLGAASACEQVNLSMNVEEVAAGNQRVGKFVARA